MAGIFAHEGWHAISEVNPDLSIRAWSRETVHTRCVLARENRSALAG
jgi:hypothetical protein